MRTHALPVLQQPPLPMAASGFPSCALQAPKPQPVCAKTAKKQQNERENLQKPGTGIILGPNYKTEGSKLQQLAEISRKISELFLLQQCGRSGPVFPSL